MDSQDGFKHKLAVTGNIFCIYLKKKTDKTVVQSCTV